MTDHPVETTPSPFTHEQLLMAARLAGIEPNIPRVIDDRIEKKYQIK